MATREWLGNALAVQQITTWLFAGTWEATDIITITCNGKTITVVAGDTVAATIATTVHAALAASTIPEFTEVTWTVDTATITATGAVAGRPFTYTFATTETGGGAADAQTINGGTSSTGTDATACTGPNYADNTANWSGGSLPVDGDDVVIRRPVSILYGLTGLSGVYPATLKIYREFWAGGAQIGLAEIRGTGNTAYNEYRSRFLQFNGAAAVDIGLGSLSGGNAPGGGASSLLNLDFQTSSEGATAITVHRTPQSSDNKRPALCLILNPSAAADGTLEVLAGSVGVGWYNESCKVTARDGYRENQAGDSQVYFGPGVTHGATFNQSGGVVEINTATTEIVKSGGTLTINGSGAHPTVDNQAGTIIYNSTGTIGGTSIKCGATGVIDFSQDMSAKALGTTLQAYRGATVINPHGIVTSFAVRAVGCRLAEINIVSAPDKTWTPS
jgi:hypothetical protein